MFWILWGYSSLNAQVIEIETVIITPLLRSSTLHLKPYSEHVSLAPSISKISFEDVRRQGAITLIDAMNGERQMAIALPPTDQKYRDMIQNFDPYKALLSNLKLTYRPNKILSAELQLFYSLRNATFIDEVTETSSNEKDYEYGFNFIQSFTIFPGNVLRFGGLYNHWIAPNGKRLS